MQKFISVDPLEPGMVNENMGLLRNEDLEVGMVNEKGPNETDSLNPIPPLAPSQFELGDPFITRSLPEPNMPAPTAPRSKEPKSYKEPKSNRK